MEADPTTPEPTPDALARIDAALARIEAQLDAPRASGSEAAELARLREAHERLRGRVGEALAAIDRMLKDH